MLIRLLMIYDNAIGIIGRGLCGLVLKAQGRLNKISAIPSHKYVSGFTAREAIWKDIGKMDR